MYQQDLNKAEKILNPSQSKTFDDIKSLRGECAHNLSSDHTKSQQYRERAENISRQA